MKVFSQLESAQLEILPSNPTGIIGRVFYNSTDDMPYYYDGVKWQVFTSIKNNMDAVADPLPADDADDNYEKGSIWFNSSNGQLFICIDETVGLAVWKPIETLKNNYTAIVEPTITDDSSAGYSVGSKWINTEDQTISFCVDATVGAAIWNQSGSGGGGLDIFFSEDFKVFSSADMTTGNNATPLGGGSIAGTLSDEEVAPLAGKRSIKYEQIAGSLNDYFFMEVIDLDLKQRGNDVGLNFYFKDSGNDGDHAVIVYDVTNGEVISDELDLLKPASNSTRWSSSVFIPENCSQIRVGFQVKVENIGAILEFTDVEMSVNPFVYKNLVEVNSVFLEGSDGRTITANTESISFSGSGNGWVSGADGSSPTNGNYYEVQNSNSIVGLSGMITTTSAVDADIKIYLNGVEYKRLHDSRSTYLSSGKEISYMSSKGEFSLGDKIALVADNGITLDTSVSRTYLNINETWEIENLITPASATTENIFYSGYSSRDAQSRILFSTEEQNNSSDLLSVTNSGHTRFTALKECFATIHGQAQRSAGGFNVRVFIYDSGDNRIAIAKQTSNGTEHANASITWKMNVGDYVVFNSAGDTFASDNETNFGITAMPTEVKMLAATPPRRIAYIKDVKPSGTNGGTFTAGTRTRDLNTIEGDTSFISLLSNQFTLQKGKYSFEVEALAYLVNRHQAFIYNVTDGVEVLLGSSMISSQAANGGSAPSSIKGEVTLLEAKVFELRHNGETSVTTTGFGVSSNFGFSNVYSQIKIEKLR